VAGDAWRLLAGSYPVADILDRVQQVVAEGVVEIWLTSEDTGAYGRDIGTSIVVLLRAILEACAVVG
jgi:threonylcarbamoyladenosine tRNA methylthiotransferase CDKAL1